MKPGTNPGHSPPPATLPAWNRQQMAGCQWRSGDWGLRSASPAGRCTPGHPSRLDHHRHCTAARLCKQIFTSRAVTCALRSRLSTRELDDVVAIDLFIPNRLPIPPPRQAGLNHTAPPHQVSWRRWPNGSFILLRFPAKLKVYQAVLDAKLRPTAIWPEFLQFLPIQHAAGH